MSGDVDEEKEQLQVLALLAVLHLLALLVLHWYKARRYKYMSGDVDLTCFTGFTGTLLVQERKY